MAVDSDQISILIEALNRTPAAFNQVLAQMGQMDRQNIRSTQTEQRATGAIRNSAEALLGLRLGYLAAAAAIGQYARATLSSVDALAKEARSLEVTTERLSGFKFAMEQSGIAANESSQQLNFLLKAMQEAAGNPTSEAANAFKAVGIALEGINNREVLDVVSEVSDAFEKHSGAAQKAAIAQALFGRNSRATIEFLNGGSKSIRENIELFDKFGGTVKGLTADQIEKFNDTINTLNVGFKAIALTLADQVLPLFNKFTNALLALPKSTLSPLLFGPASLLIGSSSAASPTASAPKSDAGKTPFADPAAQTSADEAKKKSIALLEELNLARLQKQAELTDDFADREDAAREQERIAHRRNDDDIAALTLVSQQSRNELEQVEAERHLKSMEAITNESLKDELDKRLQLAEAKKQLRDNELHATSDMFGNLATTAKAFGQKGLVAYKVFATAQALVDGYKAATGAMAAMSSIPFVGPALGVAAAAAALGAAGAQIAAIQGVSAGFAEGGFTGAGGKHDVAGPVHRGEVVIPAKTVRTFGLPFFAENFFSGRMPGYSTRGFAGGGFAGSVGTPAITSGGGSPSFHFSMGDTRNAQRDFMAKEGTRMVIDALQRRGNVIR